jgi:RNA polymerase primary sigma factor
MDSSSEGDGESCTTDTRLAGRGEGRQGGEGHRSKVVRSGIDDCDIQSRNQLVQANLDLVRQVARQYLNRGLTVDDLIGEGNLGLIRAAQHYDPTLGTRFSTYASYWIRDAILRGLANTAATIRVPTYISKLLTRWRRTERALGHLHGHAPTFEEVAAAMNLDEATQQLIARAHCVTRLQEQTPDGSEAASPALLMRDEGITAEDRLTAHEEKERVSRRLAGLEGPERAVVVFRFGLSGEPPMSFEQISDRVGITMAAVQKIASTALRKLGRLREASLIHYDRDHRSQGGSSPLAGKSVGASSISGKPLDRPESRAAAGEPQQHRHAHALSGAARSASLPRTSPQPQAAPRSSGAPSAGSSRSLPVERPTPGRGPGRCTAPTVAPPHSPGPAVA